MNKKILFLCLGLLLTSCGNNVSSNVSISSDTSSIVSNSNLSEKVSSNNKVNSNSEVKKEEYKTFSYSYHPLSEPSINNQLLTFNPMGDLKNVWNYYRGDTVTVAVIDSGFDTPPTHTLLLI